MAQPLESFFNVQRGRRASPTKAIGRPGTQVFGGYIVENELSGELSDRRRYLTFSEMLANTSIVAAGVRYFLNLCAKSSWTFEPSEEDRDGKFAELAEQILTDDPTTSFPRIVRRAAMYRFYGFSIQEWIARRRDDGVMTLADVAPRPQITIERWDLDEEGGLLGVIQRNPQNSQEIYLPRQKLVYMVDDTLSDSPQGFGLFRNIVAPAKRLERYEQLEGFGFETDLRGIPIARIPYARLRKMVNDGEIESQEATDAIKSMEDFVKNHVKRPDLGLTVDSAPYESLDAAASPSSVPQFDLKLLEGTSTSLPDMARSIERLNREIARVLGVEAILLGDGNRGSHALSTDKTNQFSLIVDATLDEVSRQFGKDLLKIIWQLNGWPQEMMPRMNPEAVQYREIEQVTGALRDMADAGATLMPDDPAIREVRAMVGLSSPSLEELAAAAAMRDAQLSALTQATGASPAPGGAGENRLEGSPDDPETDIPEDPNQNGR